jgi:(p)ppGpp synthase/HD superfamily hydrolase
VTGSQRLREVGARLSKTQAAVGYAERAHSGQQRNTDGAPFIEHPLEVGWLLYRDGAPDHMIAAGVLHDVLENTAVTPAQLSERFGERVAVLVRAVSEDPEVPGYSERKTALRRQVAAAGPKALTIFAADKVSKVRELRAAIQTASRQGERIERRLARPRRLAHLRRYLGMLQERLSGSPLVEQLAAELTALTDELATQRELSAFA